MRNSSLAIITVKDSTAASPDVGYAGSKHPPQLGGGHMLLLTKCGGPLQEKIFPFLFLAAFNLASSSSRTHILQCVNDIKAFKYLA